MSLRRKVISGSLVISIGEVVSSVCAVIRNVVLARLLSKEDFGIAATLTMTLSLLEVGARMSIEGVVVQSSHGNQPAFIGVCHLVQMALGIISSALIFLAAWPMATCFKVPDALWAFQLLALLPLARAFGNLDVSRMQRDMRFWPGVAVDVGTQLLITILVWPLTLVRRDYSVLIWLMIARAFLTMFVTHFIAEERVRFAWQRAHVKEVFAFGLPLLISGFLMFGVSQGDRALIGTAYTMADLGVYAVAGTLAIVPAMMLMKVGGTALLPVLAAAKDSSKEFERRLAICAQGLAILSAVYALTLIVSGESLIIMIFGEKYKGVGSLTAYLALGQAVRLIRVIPTLGAMAKGDTGNLMYANFCRLSGLLFALPVVMIKADLAFVAAAAVLGEVVALLASGVRFGRRHGVKLRTWLRHTVLAGTAVAGASVLSLAGIHRSPWWVSLGVSAVLTGFLLTACYRRYPWLREQATDGLRRVQQVMSRFVSLPRKRAKAAE